MSEGIKMLLLRLLKDTEYKQIILFGSRARGDNREDSDYDILVIVDNKYSIEELRKIECNIRKEMAKNLIDVDILVRTEEITNQYERISGNVIYEAMKEGVLL